MLTVARAVGSRPSRASGAINRCLEMNTFKPAPALTVHVLYEVSSMMGARATLKILTGIRLAYEWGAGA